MRRCRFASSISRNLVAGFLPLTWGFAQGLSLTPPALDPIGYLIGAIDKKGQDSEGNALSQQSFGPLSDPCDTGNPPVLLPPITTAPCRLGIA
jgi:hypothetical protein